MKKAIVLLLCSVVSLFSANGQFHTSRFSEKVSPQNDIRAIAFDRLLVQLEDVSPFVERIAVYQYCGMLSKPGSTAATDHPSAERLYKDYRRWLDAQHWL